jgi:hypothetical protein
MALSSSSKSSSRANSLSNIFGLGSSKDETLRNPLIIVNNQNVSASNNEEGQPQNDDEIYVDHDVHDDDDYDPDYRPTRHLTATQNHPMGRILLGLLNENIRLARKANVKSMELNVDNLCADFVEAMKLMNDSAQRSILLATSGIEDRILSKELNAHTINMSIEPPSRFSARPKIRDLQHKAEIMKMFPIRHKFTGSMQDSSMDIVEYLGLMRDAQNECNLSEKEFKAMLMASTTGKPHALIREWIANEEDIPTIYHNLIIHYDKRIAPEQAKTELSTYKVPKNSNLAKVEAHLMALANRAATMLPAGPSRTAFYNMEVIHALIRGLPPSSSSLVQMKYNELSARQGRAATVAELSRALHSVRYAIDKDIKTNGQNRTADPVNPRTGIQRAKELSRRGAYKYKTSYAVTQPVSNIPMVQHYPSRDTTYMADNSGTQRAPQRGRSNSTSRRFPNSRSNSQPGTNRSRPGNFRQGNTSNFQRPQSGTRVPNRYCSLCGKKDHVAAQGCPYIVNDAGTVVKMMPTLGTCQACPANIVPRLNHPSQLCPYRIGGPLERPL